MRFCGISGQSNCYHGDQKLPLTYNGKNGISRFSQPVLIRSFSNLVEREQAPELTQIRNSAKFDFPLRN